MPSKALEKSAKLMARRLVIAERHAKAVRDEFSERYRDFIYGAPWLQTQEQREAHMLARQGGEDGERVKRGWDTTTFPLHGIQRNVMLPYLMANHPVFVNRQRPGATLLESAKIDLMADVAMQIWMESETTAEMQRALDDAYCLRMGWMKTYYDDQEGLPVHRWVDANDMLLDCQTKSPRMRDRRWIAEKMVLPIETAEWFAKSRWDAAKHKFQTVEFDDTMEGATQTARGSRRSRTDGGTDDESAGSFVRIVMVQVKGQNPHTMSADFGKRTNDDPAGLDDVYDGKDHVLILEATNGFAGEDGFVPIGRIDWAFPCKRGQFTYTPMVMTKDNRSVYPYSIMQPGHSSQIAADLGIQSFNTDVRNSARRWGAIQPEAFADAKDADRIAAGEDALMLAVLKPGYDPARAISVQSFGQPSGSTKEAHAVNRENYEAIQGMNKFDVQVRANQTALNTSVQNEGAQVKIEDVSGLVERSVVELAEKGVMCARANMTYEDLLHWVNVTKTLPGPDGQPVNLEEESQTKDGTIIVESALWTNDPDFDAIRRETEVNLESRSIRFVNPEKEAEDIKQIQDYQLQVQRIIGDTVKGGAVDAAKEIARTANESITLVCKLKNILNYERFLFDYTKLMPPVPPPVDPNQQLQAQVQAQGNMVQQQGNQMQAANAAQQAAMTRLEQQGANTGILPQDAGGGGG